MITKFTQTNFGLAHDHNIFHLYLLKKRNEFASKKMGLTYRKCEKISSLDQVLEKRITDFSIDVIHAIINI